MKTFVIAVVALAASVSLVSAADAKDNWTKSCAKCHGEDGKGQTKMGQKLKAKDYTDAKVQDALKDDEMVKIIKDGKKEGDKPIMKGFADDLSADEIKALTAYVRQFKK